MKIIVFLFICLGFLSFAQAFQGTEWGSDFNITGDLLGGSRGFLMGGESYGINFGTSTSAIGDFNGDGIDDFAVGAVYAGPNNAGVCYVMFGRNGTFSDIDMSSFVYGTNGFYISGVSTDVGLSLALSKAGDVNGDGFDDFIVGTFISSPLTRVNAGSSFVLFGSAGPTFPNIDLNSFNDFSKGFAIYGAAASDFAGKSVGGGGDLNRDGFADLIVGAYAADPRGRNSAGVVYVVYGKSSYAAHVDLGTLSGSGDGFLILGGAAGDGCGKAVAAAGDVNADGTDDVLLSCTYADPFGRNNAGSVYTIFGRVGNDTDIDLLHVPGSAAGFRISGPTASSNFGSDVNTAGDVNGDGYTDIVVSCATFEANTGRAWVLFGHNFSSPFPDVDLYSFTSGSSGFIIQYPSGLTPPYLYLGQSVAGAGDVNGDGIDDLIISTENIGTVTVIFGKMSPFSSIDMSTFVSSPATGVIIYALKQVQSTQLGNIVRSAGDINNDGAPDILIGASTSSFMNRAEAGQVYVLYGKPPPPFTAATNQVRNGFAFAVTTANGSVFSWGEQPNGGDASAVQAYLDATEIDYIVPTRFAFTAVARNGSVLAWGLAASTARAPSFGAPQDALKDVVATEAAFAGITSTGGVVAFGGEHSGGNVEENNDHLMYSVVSIVPSAAAFAALASDGTVYSWGNAYTGAGTSSATLLSLAGVQQVAATREAFAALLSTGAVVAWGGKLAGGDTSSVAGQLTSGIAKLAASKIVFVALKNNTAGIVVWGYSRYGGDTAAVAGELAADVAHVCYTNTAMAALKTNGMVVAWGLADRGGDASAVQSQLVDIVQLFGSSSAFAALNKAGGVVAWGKGTYGGSIPVGKASALSSGVETIVYTDRAFAALKADGSVVVWGQAGHGGEPGDAVEALLTSDVHTVCGNDAAFSAIKTNGDVVGWGHAVSIPVPGVLFNSIALGSRVACA
jgi:hypothetical protein